MGALCCPDSKLAAMEVSGVFDLDEPEALLRTLEQRYGLKVTYLPPFAAGPTGLQLPVALQK
jgi:transmembrane sensor